MGQSRARLVGLLLLSVLATALSVRAQPPRVYRVGIVHHGGSYLRAVDGMRDGLRELGLEDGKQVLFTRATSTAT